MIMSPELQAAMGSALPVTAADVIASWQTDTRQTREEIARLLARAEELRSGILLPNLADYRESAICRKAAGIDQLIEAVRCWASSEEATRWQLRALATYQDSRTMRSLSELLNQDAGSACIAFQLSGLLSQNWRHLAPEKPSAWPLAALIRIGQELGVGGPAIDQIKQAHAELGEIDTFLIINSKAVTRG
jgi:hypothetical protein